MRCNIVRERGGGVPVFGTFTTPANYGGVTTVHLGFRPSLLLLGNGSNAVFAPENGNYYISNTNSSNYQHQVQMLDDGFTVGYAQYFAGQKACYIAFR